MLTAAKRRHHQHIPEAKGEDLLHGLSEQVLSVVCGYLGVKDHFHFAATCSIANRAARREASWPALVTSEVAPVRPRTITLLQHREDLDLRRFPSLGLTRRLVVDSYHSLLGRDIVYLGERLRSLTSLEASFSLLWAIGQESTASRAAQQLSSLTALTIHGNMSLGLAGWLPRLESLASVTCHAGLPLEAFDRLRAARALRALRLTVPLDQPLASVGRMRFAAVCALTQLTALTMVLPPMEVDDGAERLAALSRLSALRTLDLDNRGCEHNLLQHVLQAPLTDLSLSSLAASGMRPALMKLARLTAFRLRGEQASLGDVAAVCALPALKRLLLPETAPDPEHLALLVRPSAALHASLTELTLHFSPALLHEDCPLLPPESLPALRELTLAASAHAAEVGMQRTAHADGAQATLLSEFKGHQAAAGDVVVGDDTSKVLIKEGNLARLLKRHADAVKWLA